MTITKEQQLSAQVIQRAWEDSAFKSKLMANPVEEMEKLTGHKVNLREGQKLVVVDQSNESEVITQSDDSTIYFTIPKKPDMDSIELTEEELEAISGGVTPACFYVGMVIGVAFWAAIS